MSHAYRCRHATAPSPIPVTFCSRRCSLLDIRYPPICARVGPIPVKTKAVQIWDFGAYESVAGIGGLLPGGMPAPFLAAGRRAADQVISVLICREHPAQTARGLARLVRPWRCAGPRAPGVRAIGPCLRPVAGAMVGNGGTAIKVMACGLAWREQNADRQQEHVLRWPAPGLAA